IVFGVPRSDPEHRFHAVACAVLIRRVVVRLNAQREAQGQQPIHFRIGINCGQMLAGNMGSRDRMQYTVVGDAVNLASRLATHAEADEILIDEEMYRHAEVSGRVIAQPHGTIPIRGRREPATLYRIIDLSPDYRQQLEAMVDRVLEAGE
ncbi:MAG TPA: adenylate/guanylate cyclase domain-containing protein, partial [Chromatiales bacterium]|nr:adenylate/guanylate cyclase domain-containing protein [Chromatiales bacterium]